MKNKKRKSSRDAEVHLFAERIRRSTDQKIWDECHKQPSLELCEAVMRDLHEDIVAVLAPHFDDDITQKINRILGKWYGFKEEIEVVDERRAEFNARFNVSEDREIAPGKIYRHFKGNYYQVMYIAVDSETEETVVVYRSLMNASTDAVFVRPKAMFASEVDHEKYPNVAQKWRFQRVEEVPK